MKSLLYLALATSLVSAAPTTNEGCTALAAEFSSKVKFPTDAAYTEANTAYFDQRSVMQPGCIFLPTSAEDVAGAVKILGGVGTKFAVKSGGHMPGQHNNIGSAGVLIALQNLTTFEWAENDTVLRVPPGPRWGTVYEKANEKGKIVIGGRLKQVGVAGLLLGGGISYNAGQYGFSCDNVKGYQIVTSSGEIKYASSTENPDLYKVLRGGQGNFGIVTRFDMDAYPQGAGYTNVGTIILKTLIPGIDLTPKFLTAAGNYVTSGAKSNPNTGAIAVITVIPALGITLGMLSLWSAAAVKKNIFGTVQTPTVFKEFVSIPGIHTEKSATLSSHAAAFGNTDALGGLGDGLMAGFQTFRTQTFVADAGLIKEIAAIWSEEYAKIKSTNGLMHALTFQPLTPNHVLTGANRRGGNVLGLEEGVTASSKGFMVTEMQASWGKAADTEKVEGVQRLIQQRVESLAKSKNLLVPWVYVNDAGPEQTDAMKGYGAKNLALLQAARTKYDPVGMFKTQVPGGYKF